MTLKFDCMCQSTVCIPDISPFLPLESTYVFGMMVFGTLGNNSKLHLALVFTIFLSEWCCGPSYSFGKKGRENQHSGFWEIKKNKSHLSKSPPTANASERR